MFLKFTDLLIQFKADYLVIFLFKYYFTD